MAGHSHWANIKHKKAKADAKRGKVWSKCARAIIVAAKNGGGDPDMNVTLRYAIEDAKANNMPNATIENAIKKGIGETDGQTFERVNYEGYGPAGVAIMLDILTDNRNRTAPELRMIFSKNGGNLASAGSVSYLFQPKGQVFLPKSAGDEETVMAAALEAGAEDVIDQGESWQVMTAPSDLIAVRDALEKAGFTIESAELTMVPDNTVQVTGEDAERVLRLIDALEDHDDVQKVFANFDMPAETLEALEK
jgi:YebC/PmpR family DNA-binding regulatory protein